MTKQNIIEEVHMNYKACYKDKRIYSDTWSSIFRQKGDIYTADEFISMLSPGNRVNTWIRNILYYLDSTIIDLKNPLQRELLGIGEPELGNPYKDTFVKNKPYSSLFLFNVKIASDIIKQIDDAGIKEPRILEIGGGYGTLIGLLYAYYGNRLTVYAVDLPETLAIQEWYLRSRFPDAPTSYKATKDSISFKRGGLNFVNASVLHSQNIPIDVTVNIISMGEMHKDVSQKYIEFIERNISEQGIFYFLNAHGQCINAVPNVSEYGFDEHWILKDANFLTQFESMTFLDLLRLVFRRTEQTQNKAARRFVLRFLLNGFQAGIVPRQPGVIKKFLKATQNLTSNDATNVSLDFLRSWRVSEELHNPLMMLTKKLYFPRTIFLSPKLRIKQSMISGRDCIFSSEIANFQVSLISLMENFADHSNLSRDFAEQNIERSSYDFLNRIKALNLSEYWCGHIASILLPLKQLEKTKDFILQVGSRSKHVVWLVRFAYLLNKYNFKNESESLIRISDKFKNIPWFVALKKAEIQYFLGNKEQACHEVVFQAKSKPELIRSPLIAKTALRMNELEVFFEFCDSINAIWGKDATPIFVELMQFAASDEFPTNVSNKVVDYLVKLAGVNSIAASFGLEYGTLLMKISEANGIPLVNAFLKDNYNNYYVLGKAGGLLHWCGQSTWAEECLERALELGPRNLQQLRFVGNIRLFAKRWDKASECFEKAARIMPYMRDISGKSAYCRLPEKIRNTEIFGKPDELDMIFQQEQDFYHDIGLKYKSTLWKKI